MSVCNPTTGERSRRRRRRSGTTLVSLNPARSSIRICPVAVVCTGIDRQPDFTRRVTFFNEFKYERKEKKKNRHVHK